MRVELVFFLSRLCVWEYKFCCLGLSVVFKYLKTIISRSVFRVSVIRSTVDKEGDFVIADFFYFSETYFILFVFFFLIYPGLFYLFIHLFTYFYFISFYLFIFRKILKLHKGSFNRWKKEKKNCIEFCPSSG